METLDDYNTLVVCLNCYDLVSTQNCLVRATATALAMHLLRSIIALAALLVPLAVATTLDPNDFSNAIIAEQRPLYHKYILKVWADGFRAKPFLNQPLGMIIIHAYAGDGRFRYSATFKSSQDAPRIFREPNQSLSLSQPQLGGNQPQTQPQPQPQSQSQSQLPGKQLQQLRGSAKRPGKNRWNTNKQRPAPY